MAARTPENTPSDFHSGTSGKKRRKSHPLVRIVKFLLLTILALILLVVGITVAAVSILTPERLTPLVQHVANAQLRDAHVTVERVELSLRKTMPYLHLDVEHFYVHSHVADSMARINPDVPAYADTLLGIAHLDGGINITTLLLNKVQISDVNIVNPRFNCVVFNDSLTNFDIFPTSVEPSEPMDLTSLPHISIKRFSLTDPLPSRYHDLSTGTLTVLNFDRAYVDGNSQPVYTLRLGGNITAPMLLRYFTMKEVTFGLDGDIEWNQKQPLDLKLSNMNIQIALLKGVLNVDASAENGLLLRELDVNMDPIPVQEVLGLLPDSLKAEYGIPPGLNTTATVLLSGRLTRPFNVGGQALPAARVSLKIPDSEVRWQKVKFNNIAGDIDIDFPGDDLDKTVVHLNRFNIKGPATDLSLSATISSIVTDPLFDGTMRGTCDISKLPPVLLDKIPGSIRGHLTADAVIKGRPSMLSFSNYHNLKVQGKISVKDLYWIDADTMNMTYVTNASFDFGTNSNIRLNDGKTADSLLHARIQVDSASIMHSDLDMKLTDFRIGLAAVNRNISHRADSARTVIPMGGNLHIGGFSLMVLTDTAVVRFRGVDGHAVISAHNNDMRTPEFRFNLGIKHFSTGDKSTRMLISDMRTQFTAFMQPQSARVKKIKHTADSLIRIHPDIPYDSIYTLALELHQRNSRHGLPRVHPRMELDSTEIIDWGTSKSLNRFLLGWRLDGQLTARRAGLFTAMFPLRNRMTNLEITFNNDSILLRNLIYKAGHSDFALDGNITNVKRALTSRTGRQALKINLNLQSDTVDINQLTDAMFRGAAYMADKDSHHQQGTLDITNIEDESALERSIGEHVQNAPDSMAPLLIPKNVEANVNLHARNILYSDIALKNLKGTLMTYQGALNLHDLSAQSDIGSVNMSALYNGRDANDLQFGFGLNITRMNLHKFLGLMPAVDSIMPLLRDFSGIISAEIAATSHITPAMDLDIPTLNAAIKLNGDSLVLMDADTFKSLSKWLFFRNKKDNIIDHMSVEMLVRDNTMQMFPFIFHIDRYKLGVQGTNDFDMNFDYHIAVLKSPIPFKFGINIKGNIDDYKIRLGGAKVDEKTHRDVSIVDTVRINLISSLENVFHRGIENARFARLNLQNADAAAKINLNSDTLTHADSLNFIREGLIPAPDTTTVTAPVPTKGKKSKKSNKKAIISAPMALAMPAAYRRRRHKKEAC